MGYERSAAFAARVTLERAYAERWWEHDPTVDDLCRRTPGLRAALERVRDREREVTTCDVYALIDHPIRADHWRGERHPVHQHVLAALTVSRPLLGVPPDPPMAFITAGLPGSGKTSQLRPLAWDLYESRLEARDRDRKLGGLPAGAAVLDADDVRQLLPEYQCGLGSAVVQPETTSLTYGSAKENIVIGGGRGAVLMDVVGDPDLLPAEAFLLHNLGFAVHVLLATVPVDVAVDRVARRCVATGRLVPISYVRSRNGLPEAALEAVLRQGPLLAGWGVWDTSGTLPVQSRGAGAFDRAPRA